MAQSKLSSLACALMVVTFIAHVTASPAPGKTETKIRIHVPVKHHTHYHTRTKTLVKEVHKKPHELPHEVPHEVPHEEPPLKYKHHGDVGHSVRGGHGVGGGSGSGASKTSTKHYQHEQQQQQQQHHRLADIYPYDDDLGFTSDEYAELFPKQKTKKVRPAKNPYY